MIRTPEDPHSASPKSVMDDLSVGADGLSDEEASRRLFAFGVNEVKSAKGKTKLLIFLKQFRSWLVGILIIAAVISFITGQQVDGWVIVVVIILNAAIGFTQEYRAERAIASLQKLVKSVARVVRNGQVVNIPSEELVIGDIIVLEEGNQVPADARIIRSNNFRCVEASLTGESLPVSKTVTKLPVETVLADRRCMVWKGTWVAGGYARAVVTATGKNTALGEIAVSLGDISTGRSHFMKKTDKLARQMSVVAICSAMILFIIGYFIRKFDIQEILLTSIAALVAAVPEGLPAVISITLAIGANRMAKRKAIVREFTATETLGAVTAILTDKTGTLTQNTLTVQKLYLPGEPEISVTGDGWFPAGNLLQNDLIIIDQKHVNLNKLLRIAMVSNNADIRHIPKDNTYELTGDPTEGALHVLARKGGLNTSDFEKGKLDDLPFDSKEKYRATLYRDNSESELLVVGAPEKILKLSDHVLTSVGISDMSEELRSRIDAKITEWSGKAMRVLALGYRVHGGESIQPDDVSHLVLAGIVGMSDPPRADTREAVEKCHKLGIRVMMLTGDHINTAVAIAKATGIIPPSDDWATLALSEDQLLQLDDEEFDEALRKVSVYARLTPMIKIRIAKRLQEMGHLIAMTGDGVNDAPALKQADVGIAMGIMGTDVARDVSQVVLADDNFATIAGAVEEGRIVFSNARQASFFLVTTNLAESVTLIAALSIGLPLPLTATQILWLNLVSEGVTDVALAAERGHDDLRPASFYRKEHILNKEVLPFMAIMVVIMTSLSLAVFYYLVKHGLELARTGVFFVMSFTQLFNVFNLRSVHLSVFRIGIFTNKFINMAVVASVLLTIGITEWPLPSRIFHFEPLHWGLVLVLFGASSTVLWVAELYKWLVRRKEESKKPEY